MNNQGIEVLKVTVDEFLWHFNILPITPRIEFISSNMNRVVAALNASNLAVLIESQPLDLDLDVQDQNIQTCRPNFNFGRGCTNFLNSISFGLLKVMLTSVKGFINFG